ncbi:class I SAM-dependent methyltransferase [Mesorhizobium sp. INR15]|uniref:class I SAM-dependent methyltransferase n=1 Tax=Mesorhizobium sp. INR15 TaxID=2654248 RepID=UPI001AED7CA4|nr:class I SAM-dependent methyltransferase [Mesorhizobium sp. INR15]
MGDVAGLDILDAGCGSGISAEKLARAGARVRAFDVTPEMTALARSRCAGLGVDIREGDMSSPIDWIADRSVDGVLCALALDYVEDLKPVFAEFHRVTRPGGWLVFSMGHPMRDWADARTRGQKTYFEANRWGMHWTGFGEPNPYVGILPQAAGRHPQRPCRRRLDARPIRRAASPAGNGNHGSSALCRVEHVAGVHLRARPQIA